VRRLIVVASAFGLALTASAWGTVRYVPAEYSTIQAGIDAAVGGDTVLVADGIYTGDGNRDLDFWGKAILVASENGPEATIIDCAGSEQDPHRGLCFHTGEDSSSIVRGFTIRNGWSPSGSAIHCRDNSSPTILNNIMTGNTATYGSGGAIYCWYSSPRIEGNTISANATAYSDGGAIACWYSSPILDYNTISDNMATYGNGGAIFCRDSSPAIRGNHITANTAYDDGGGIYCWYSAPLIGGNTIRANRAIYGDCGGIYCSWCPNTTAILGNEITENIADWGGGGVWCKQSSPYVAGNLIEANTAAIGGGILCYGDDCSAIIVDNTISGNTATNQGGGIHCRNDCTPTIMGNLISLNVSGEGGGIHCSYASPSHYAPKIIENIISWNTADYGGGIHCYDNCMPIIERNRIIGNMASHHGGALYCHKLASPRMKKNVITGNVAADGSGGGIYCYYRSSPIISSGVIALNAAEAGGGIYCEDRSSPVIGDNTITENVADEGGGISCVDNSSPAAVNSIVWSNEAGIGDQIQVDVTSSISITFCDVMGGWPGVGNIDVDPMFALAEKRDYRLLWESPCIDTGHPDSLDLDGTRSDMGAFFFDQDDYLTVYLTPDTTEILPGSGFGVTYTVINRWGQPEPFWVRTVATLPNGNPLRIMGPDRYVLPGQYTAQVRKVHDVPLGAPAGEYEYSSKIGVPPWLVYDEDSFELMMGEPQ